MKERRRQGRAALGARLGLSPPPSYVHARRLLADSAHLCRLARQVSRAAPTPLDGAALLRKAIHLAFVAALAGEDESPPAGYEPCRERIAASRPLSELFEAALEQLDLLDEAVQSFDRSDPVGQGRLRRYQELLDGMPALLGRVRRHLDARFERDDFHPRRRRLLVRALLAAAALVAFALVYRQSRAPIPLPAPERDPAPTLSARSSEVPQWLLDRTDRCFFASYFSDPRFEKLVHTRRDCLLSFDWAAEPLPGIAAVGADDFSVRWEGVLSSPATDEYTFYLASDDGSRLYLGGALIVDNWGEHGLLRRRSKPLRLVRGERYPLRVDFYEGTGLAQIELSWSSTRFEERPLSGRHIEPHAAAGAAAAVTATASSVAPKPVADPSKCFAAQYFDGTALERLVHRRADCTIDFDWGTGAVPGIEPALVDRFSVRWDAELTVPEDGDYRFFLGSDDGSRLFFDGKPIAGDWSEHGFYDAESETIALRAGTVHALRVEYFEQRELARVRLMWLTPSGERAVLAAPHIGQPARDAGSEAGP
ncbi:MAG: hypothetical protein JRI55_02675 [Deltaproteobacteria bacterium]|jgi:hypothetical protein|nr:hypothetical protein [Deltaproteobacteria bacterium]